MKQTLAVVLVVVGLTGLVKGQSISADEKAIRELIARADARGRGGPLVTPDSIAWPDDFKRPSVAGERPEQVDGIQNRVGIQEGKTQIRRIDIAQSNDLAYEFSQQDVTYDEADASGKVTSRPVTTSILRVWKKTGEQWMIAAAFKQAHKQ